MTRMNSVNRWERIFCIDPGGTTGWVYGQVQMNGSAHHQLAVAVLKGRMAYGQFKGSENGAIDQMLQLIKEHKAETVVIEDYVVRLPYKNTHRAGLSPARIGAGLAYALSGVPSVTQVKFQMPSQMAVITDDRLKAWGLWLPGKPHACDAMRHMVIYLRNNMVD